jgi:hypothetical protein
MLDQDQTDNPEYKALLWALHVLSKTAKFVTQQDATIEFKLGAQSSSRARQTTERPARGGGAVADAVKLLYLGGQYSEACAIL